MTDAVQEAGEGFDPGEAWTPDGSEAGYESRYEKAVAPSDVFEAPKLSASKVAKALRTTTGYLNDVAGEKARADLQMSDTEAALIAPGLVKYLESRPQLAATVAAGGNEYLQASFGLAVYGVRVTRQRAAALESEEAAEAYAGESEGEAVSLYPLEPQVAASEPEALGASYGDE
jgi:hypothetical protein